MARIVGHLSIAELEARYRAAQDATEARHFQAIWLLAQGRTFLEAAEVLAFAPRWVEELAARYNAFRDLWRRTMQGREEGRDPASAARVKAKTEKTVAAEPVSVTCTDAHKEIDVVKSLYASLLEAKQRCGEPIEGFSFPKFHRLVAQKADGLKQKSGCKRVRFSVAVEDGHVSFKAKADQ